MHKSDPGYSLYYPNVKFCIKVSLSHTCKIYIFQSRKSSILKRNQTDLSIEIWHVHTLSHSEAQQLSYQPPWALKLTTI